ncbi:FAD/FMN-containing dehydrogenase [Microlunatus panaciterrae]|uniref:FAD/FMN-containing dehydrogenase n=1 Tax=Microlunatus panaciterrae TaxID=400768 RepID=A0ABS2RN36_9ACTN|nr:FAD/FMN-containing dehydrogenase [Microlunatus panaciterrae]
MDGGPQDPISRRAILLAAVAGAVGVAAPPVAGDVGSLRASAQTTGHAPTAADWQALSTALRGPLFRPGDPGYGSVRRTFDPRRDSARPIAIAQVATSSDVSVTLAFARRHRLAIRPRSGGHSYVGDSTGTGVLVIDTRRMNALAYDPARHRLTVGAGARLAAVHELLDRHRRTIPTGTCPTVGVAGLTLGGGIGAETRLYGLTLDAVTAIRVVTPDGRVRLVSASREPDLFWALRGGGGDNFGIVTQFVFRTFPAHSAQFFFLRFSPAAAVHVIRGWQRRLGVMPRHCWANVHLEAAGGAVVPRIVGVVWGGSARTEANALIEAIGRAPVAVSYASRSHRDAVALLAGPRGSVRQSWSAGSDIIGRPLSRAKATALVAVVQDRARTGQPGVAILDPLGGAVRDGSRATSCFPWRHSMATVQWYVGLPSTASGAAVRSAQAFIRRGHASLGRSSVGGYVNYLERGRPLADYYGSSWSGLVKVSRRYDPAGMFSSRYSIPG